MDNLETKGKVKIDIEKLERNLNQVADIEFSKLEKDVYDRAVDYKNDSKYYLENNQILYYHLN